MGWINLEMSPSETQRLRERLEKVAKVVQCAVGLPVMFVAFGWYVRPERHPGIFDWIPGWILGILAGTLATWSVMFLLGCILFALHCLQRGAIGIVKLRR